MDVMALLIYAGMVVLVVGAVFGVSLISQRRSMDWTSNESLTRAVRSAQNRALAAVTFTAILLTIGFLAGISLPQYLGLPLAVTPALSGAAGLLLYALTPPVMASNPMGELRSASLTPRSAWSFAPSSTFIGLGLLTVANLLFLILTGATSSPDSYGLYRSFRIEGPDFSSAASPYPGWYYSIPMMIATVILAGATILALRRVSSTPALPEPGFEGQDALWRVATTRIITTLVAGILSMQLGGAALIAGQAAHNATDWPEFPPKVSALSSIVLLSGIMALLASVVLFGMAASRAFGLKLVVSRDFYRHAPMGVVATAGEWQ